MNKLLLIALLTVSFTSIPYVHAEESSATATPVAAPESSKYQFTESELQSLKNSKITESQYPMVATLAKESGKTVDEIIKMRTEQKMGWGKIAKELGLSPKILGQSVSGMHRKDDIESKKERREEREMRKEERRQKRESKADHDKKSS